MIAWKYLNKYSAAITAIQDYVSMNHILRTTPQEIKDKYERICRPTGTALTGMPSAHNPQSGEERLVQTLDELDVLQERYAGAREYMAWWGPAWHVLTDTQRTILTEFYMRENRRSGANARLQQTLGYSERQVERLRSQSLNRLAILLYGR